jgi:hypothetical protein
MPRYAEPAERTEVGARIDPATAEVWFDYAQTLAPYGDVELEPEFQQVGREWFAADPVEQIAVHFHDLPATTQAALEDKRQPADRKGWEQILRAVSGRRSPSV